MKQAGPVTGEPQFVQTVIGDKLSGLTLSPLLTAGLFGEHTDAVLRSLGVSEAEIAALRAAGTVA